MKNVCMFTCIIFISATSMATGFDFLQQKDSAEKIFTERAQEIIKYEAELKEGTAAPLSVWQSIWDSTKNFLGIATLYIPPKPTLSPDEIKHSQGFIQAMRDSLTLRIYIYNKLHTFLGDKQIFDQQIFLGPILQKKIDLLIDNAILKSLIPSTDLNNKTFIKTYLQAVDMLFDPLAKENLGEILQFISTEFQSFPDQDSLKKIFEAPHGLMHHLKKPGETDTIIDQLGQTAESVNQLGQALASIR